MKTTVRTFSKRYIAALRTHLAEGQEKILAHAAELGREALWLDLAPPDLAMIHEEALTALMPAKQAPGDGNGTIRQAGCFFRQALAPFEKASGAARQANAPAEQSAEQSETGASAADMNALKKRLQREVVKCKTAEDDLKEIRRQYARFLTESKIMHKQLQHLSHEVLRAQEEERRKISRELHDEISQILMGINVRLTTLRIESAANVENISEKIADTQRLVEKSVATVHRFARELRPAMLDELGLIPALTAHLKEIRKRTGLHIHLTASKDAIIETVDSLKRTMLYRIAQEALRNIEKHAQASRVKLSVQVEPDQIRLEVADDGKSFPTQDVFANKRRQRMGLTGMCERAEMVGGKFDIESAPGKGTTVRVLIPLHNSIGE